MTARLPKRHWLTYGNDPLPTGAEALQQPLSIGARRPRHASLQTVQVGMDPPPPGFDRVVISCRACGHTDVLDLQAGVMTPDRLRCISPRCSECMSSDVVVTIASTDSVSAGQ